jgi:PBP superfamily domain
MPVALPSKLALSRRAVGFRLDARRTLGVNLSPFQLASSMRSKFFPLTVAAAVGFLGALVSGASAQAPGAPGEVTLTGAGSTFPSTLYAKWFEAYHEVDPSARFAYDANGSGAGQREIIDRTVDFGASDQPMSDEALAQAPAGFSICPPWQGPDYLSAVSPDWQAHVGKDPTLNWPVGAVMKASRSDSRRRPAPSGISS